MKLHFGCGTNILPNWDNHDIDVDITKPLPFADNAAEAVFCEHVVEHTTSPDALRFFKEALRVLKPLGVFRVAVPSVTRIAAGSTGAYERFCYHNGYSKTASWAGVLEAIITHHGHLSVWSPEIMQIFLEVAGFNAVGQVDNYIIGDMEAPNSHWRVLGKEFDDLETITFEGRK